MHDLIIRGGTIVDGTGASKKTGDIAIDNGMITAMGKVGAGHREIDADGLLVTPGFVDVHTHYDAQVTWDPTLSPSSGHGCTTVVMGNCGVGFAPVREHQQSWLIGLMEGVEDIPGAALSEGIQWDWESFPEYLDALDGKSCVMDFATQIPHGAVRAYIMGERGADNQDATADDVAAMAELVREGIEAGALGFSTSRTPLHKAIDGRFVPGTFAAQQELWAIAEGMKAGGGGVFQVACDHATVPQDLDWIGKISRELDLPAMFNLSQIDQDPIHWTRGLQALEAINAAGARVKAQVAGRAIGIVMAWRWTAHPFALQPSWLALQEQGWEAQWAALQDPSFRHKLITEESIYVGDFERFVTSAFHKMFPIGSGYEPEAASSIAAQAQARGLSPREIAMDWLMEHQGEGMIYFPLFNYSDGSLDPLWSLHQHEHTLMGLSDAGAHCGAICDGGMPTFMLTHWARDRTRGERLGLEWVIHRQTQQTAEAYGFFDRGILAPGYRADINLIDLDRLALGRPRLVWDLPAGGRRLLQSATGYRATICAGQVTENDTLTGALPRQLVRGSQAAPQQM